MKQMFFYLIVLPPLLSLLHMRHTSDTPSPFSRPVPTSNASRSCITTHLRPLYYKTAGLCPPVRYTWMESWVWCWISMSHHPCISWPKSCPFPSPGHSVVRVWHWVSCNDSEHWQEGSLLQALYCYYTSKLTLLCYELNLTKISCWL